MVWTVSIALCAVAVAAALAYKICRLKKDIYDFADSFEKSLDAVIEGRTPDPEGEMEDTLTGRVNEKLQRTEHILEQKSREIRESREQMKELIADISHQTKTPIANQKLYLEILKSRNFPKEDMELLDRLEHQTDKLEFLFQSMVKMSRLETGVIQIRKKEQDLMETIGSAVSGIVPGAEAKKLLLSVEMEEGAEMGNGQVILSHDRKWTEEAIHNLLDNAVKYTGPGGNIAIRVTRGEVFTEIHVRDSGKGIALERQAQIFTRFYREPEVHDQEGLGIGLYLTRKIAELQGGYVQVRSEPGQGSDFCIYLPNG